VDTQGKASWEIINNQLTLFPQAPTTIYCYQHNIDIIITTTTTTAAATATTATATTTLLLASFILMNPSINLGFLSCYLMMVLIAMII